MSWEIKCFYFCHSRLPRRESDGLIGNPENMANKIKIKIRSAKVEDLKRISYVTKLSWKKPYKKEGHINNFHERPDFVEHFLKKEIFILVAVFDNKIIGAIRYEFKNKEEIYFSKLVTMPSFRGQGVGAALVRELENIAQKRKIKKISLDVMAEKFLAPYYQSLGYKISKTVKHFDHHDVYMFKKII